MCHAVMRSFFITVVALVLSAVPTAAIIGGEFDGTRHPYVAVVTDLVTGVCSGSAISPTIIVTSAHCFAGDFVPPFEPVPAFVSFEPDTAQVPVESLLPGTAYPDPRFGVTCGRSRGLPDVYCHDGAVIVLNEPVVLERYAQLPSAGQIDTLGKRPQVDIVGYGIQSRFKEWDPVTTPFTRHFGTADLTPGVAALGAEFIKVAANSSKGQARICAGDSGGPVLVGDTILATPSLTITGNCVGVIYAYRIDTPEALAFVELVAGGGVPTYEQADTVGVHSAAAAEGGNERAGAERKDGADKDGKDRAKRDRRHHTGRHK